MRPRSSGQVGQVAVKNLSLQNVANAIRLNRKRGPIWSVEPIAMNLSTDPPGINRDEVFQPGATDSFRTAHRYADLLSFLDQQHRISRLSDRPRRDRTRRPGADHHDII